MDDSTAKLHAGLAPGIVAAWVGKQAKVGQRGAVGVVAQLRARKAGAGYDALLVIDGRETWVRLAELRRVP